MLFCVLFLLVLGVALVGAARLYLTSQRVARRVADRMADVLGGTVSIRAVDIGLTRDTTLEGLAAYQGDGTGAEAPWLEVERAFADVSAFGLVVGELPRDVTLHEPSVTLRFDRDNHLLTRLPTAKKTPEALPEVRIEGGRFTLEQEGRPPMAASGLQAKVDGGPGIHLKGTIDDPYWGKWEVEASLDPQTKVLTLQLDSGPTHVTMEMLHALPFVPKKVWEEVQVEGDTPVHFTQTFRPAETPGGKPVVHYRIELEPRNTTVYIPCIKLHAEQASGKVVIEDKVVTLIGVQGRSADGEIKTDAVLDFRPADSKLSFKIDVQGLVLHGLPKTWKVPAGIDGKLTGHADLQVTVVKGKARPQGKGEGRIDNPRLGVFHPKKPIRITMHADEHGFKFRPTHTEAETSATALGALWMLALVAPPPKEPPGDDLTAWTTQLPNALGHGIATLTRKAVDAAWSGVSWLGSHARRDARPAPQSTDYVEADLSLEDVNLAELIAGLKVQLPFSLSGTLSFNVRVGVPIDTPGELKAYRLEGKATLPRLVLAGVEMTDVRAAVKFNEGILELTELRGRLPTPQPGMSAGSFWGTARLGVRPLGDLSAKLEVDNLPLDQVLALLPGAVQGSEGVLSGKVSARAPSNRLTDPAAWEATATLSSAHLRAYGLNLADSSAQLALAHGVARVEDFHGRLEGGPVQTSGELSLAAPYKYTAKVGLQDVDLAGLNRLAPDFRPPVALAGKLRFDADLHGELRPATLSASGSARASDLEVEGLKIDSLALDWVKNLKDWSLRSIRVRLYGGEVTGSAVVPVAPSAEGKADLRLKDVDAQAFSKAVQTVPVKLEGQVSGTVSGKLTPEKAGRPRSLSADIELSAPRLRVQGIPTQRVTGGVEYRPGGAAEYHLQGESLGGRFKLQGKLPPRNAASPEPGPVRPASHQPDPSPPPPDGRLQVEGVRLQQLWDVYRLGDILGPLRGTVSLDLPFRHVGPSREPVGQGLFRLIDLRWKDEVLSSSIQGELRLGPQGLEFRELSGSLGGGLMRASFRVPLKGRDFGWFNVSATGVEVSRLLLPWPALQDRVQGPVDIALRGRLGAEWNGGGTAVLNRGRLFGIEVTDLRLPVQFAFAPRQARGEMTVSDVSGNVAQGRLVGRGQFTFADGARASGQLRFSDVNLRTLLGSAGEVGSIASGRLTGRFDFSGADMHSVNDLTGTLTATLNETQALQFPVLRQIAPFLRVGASATTFQNGQLEARLNRGTLNVQHFSLESTLVQIMIEGTVSLEGRLNLDVTARTGNLAALPVGLRLLGLRIPIAGPIPLSLITEASLLLARSTVHLSVTGSVRNPVVTVEPLRLLTEQAVRYFILRAIVPSA
jgi:uncharacterized protein involved in outer membrane biogenesis